MDQATKKEKYEEKKNSSRNLIIKIAMIKLNEKTIQPFIADVLASQKICLLNRLLTWKY